MEALGPGPPAGMWQWWHLMVRMRPIIMYVLVHMTFHVLGIWAWDIAMLIASIIGCPPFGSQLLSWTIFAQQ